MWHPAVHSVRAYLTGQYAITASQPPHVGLVLRHKRVTASLPSCRTVMPRCRGAGSGA
jgi:hypothetical protein